MAGNLGTGNVTRQNIIIGPGNLYTAALGTALPTWTSGGANFDFDASADWNTVGATMEGVEVGYQPEFGEVVVDQLKDAAKMFNQGVTFTFSTQLAEVTLMNLALAWGQDGSDGDILTTSTTTDTFNIAVPDDSPFEFKVAIVGEAPPSDPSGTGDDLLVRDRIYVAHRVISVEGSTHAMRRTDATTFPVSFRCLPDPAQSGNEYGQIVDRIPAA